MTTAPERISIKRRRADEPVEHLLYQSKKQRTQNHVFVRLAADGKAAHSQITDEKPSSTIDSSLRFPGIPVVKATKPGDEVRDFQKYRAAQNTSNDTAPTTQQISDSVIEAARRFHLTRDLSTTARSQRFASIRKARSNIRPHLPTFVEKQDVLAAEAIYLKPPIDRIVHSTEGEHKSLEIEKQTLEIDTIKKTEVAPFRKPSAPQAKTGHSIEDDIDTWDIESDQLADELFALALEMDPEVRAAHESDIKSQQRQYPPDAMQVDDPNEYVYETYVRMQQSTVMNLNPLSESKSFGYLIIDADEEELWDQYLRDEADDDDDWDEEDEDSNAEDNPRNEYPDEELSSDDEYGRNIYKYRQDHSDDEQFDEDD